jgi:endonuclease YncB( thermonuclease family)
MLHIGLGVLFKRTTERTDRGVAERIRTLQTHGYDKYKRTLGDVILPDRMNLHLELVRQGWRWWYRKYAPGNTVLEGPEAEAREAKKGLWLDPHPVPPWEWRKRK